MKFEPRRFTLVLLVVGSTLTTLTACFPLAVGGAVVGGLVATDRRTTGTVVEDEGIELRSASRIRAAMGDRGHINVTSYNRQVLLTGEVPSVQDKQQVEQIVAGVDNVRHIVNELAILGNSTLTQRSSDSLVTGRVRAGLIDASTCSEATGWPLMRANAVTMFRAHFGESSSIALRCARTPRTVTASSSRR